MNAIFETFYMDDAVFNLADVIEDAEEDLADVDFDTLVGTGFSGSIVIPSLALAMGKKFVLIRKENDGSHHGGGRPVGSLGKRWIFVDDFIYSGATMARVIDKVDQAARQRGVETEMIGSYLYCGQLWKPAISLSHISVD